MADDKKHAEIDAELVRVANHDKGSLFRKNLRTGAAGRL